MIPEPALSRVLVSVGNSRTRFALARDDQLEPSQVVSNDRLDEIVEAIVALSSPTSRSPIAVASVNNPVADDLEIRLGKLGLSPTRFGRDLPVPIATAFDDASAVGVDRLLDALGAFCRSSQACVVIDAGTAVTVDFVDGDGVFQGGAIAPGLRMMLRALHEQTSALPELTLPFGMNAQNGGDSEKPTIERPFGQSTLEAMTIGVLEAVRGLAHGLIDRYAEFNGSYPRIVATGGDAPMLFQRDELVEQIVPDLTLIGMLEAIGRLEALGDGAPAPEEPA